jgi:GntR family transcriptional regulator/MocR family aminotransferase
MPIGLGLRSNLVKKIRANIGSDVLLDFTGQTGPSGPTGPTGPTGPAHARLASALREAIRRGALSAGSTLPPSRALATELGCSRWVVTEAYAQLTAEGYLAATVGSGTRVRHL